ncbi:hypothetical protein DLAC_08139 [Tieghemostelium lacteum]|uniref:Uncharacterized protein n=1 Tax=Tieghemostelium lacteum TaxID=361077 RepID=A0A151ZB81_TIELA|nr:hypothetical protein DLAC_08139 [Tieghemostelium lacteum]|eukprot:KYQ91213.1 hypothetical protein DLAC_08139 [Tieghemostelium lacteum]
MTSLPLPLPFKFDVSKLKSKIEEVESATKTTFRNAAASLGVIEQDTSKPNKVKYYMGLIQDTKPSLTEEEFLSITPQEFFDESFDSTKFILDMMPMEVSGSSQEFSRFLDKNINSFSRSMDYVNSKIYNRVRKNYTEFVHGMSQIHEVGQELQRSTVMVASGRRTLTQTKKNLTSSAFMVMSKYSKRNILQKMYYDLSQIKGIVTLETLLKQTLSDGDYPATIKLYLECRSVIAQQMHYSCIPELDSNLQEIYEVVQQRLDKDFFNSCRSFDAETYQRVFQAYKLLGRASNIHDKLQQYFVDPIEPETRNIVYSHVLLSEESLKNPEIFKGMSYKELCKALKDQDFVNCLLGVFEYLCDVMTSLHLMNQFHEENPINEESKVFQDIKSALSRFKKSIWDIMQKQVTYLLEPRKLTNFKIDDFLLVLNSVNKISEIGEEFSGNPSHHLKQSIINQSKSYFDSLHRSKVDDLRTMLENEPWNNIPVANDFNAKTELRIQKIKLNTSTGSSQKPDGHLIQTIKEKGNPFSQLISYKKNRVTTPTLKSPTLPTNNTSKNTHSKTKQQDQDSDSDDDELKQDFINEDSDDEDDPKSKKPTPKPTATSSNNSNNSSNSNSQVKEQPQIKLVSSSTISFVRNIGKYLEMMEQLPHISIDIFQGICQLIEYYMYTIYSFSGYLDPQGFSLEALTTKFEKSISEKQVEDLSFTKPLVQKFLNRMKDRVGLPISQAAASVVTNLSSMPSISSISNQFSSLNNTMRNIVSNIGNTGSNSPNITSTTPTMTSQNSNNNLGIQQPKQQQQQQQQQQKSGIKWITPRIDVSGLQLGDKSILFNLPLRMVAIESLNFISEAMEACKPVFEQLLPSNQTDNFKEFYSNVVSVIPDLQRHLIKSMISAIFSHLVGPQYFSNTIAGFKWNQTAITTDASVYVKIFEKEFKLFLTQLNDCCRQSLSMNGTPIISAELRNHIVQISFEFFIIQLVDGYSRIKKCAKVDVSRAIMLKDLTLLQTSIEQIALTIFKTPIKVPNMAYAQTYLKAYLQFPVFEEELILDWARNHDEYPLRFVVGIIQLCCKEKLTQSLIMNLDELERRRRPII